MSEAIEYTVLIVILSITTWLTMRIQKRSYQHELADLRKILDNALEREQRLKQDIQDLLDDDVLKQSIVKAKYTLLNRRNDALWCGTVKGPTHE